MEPFSGVKAHFAVTCACILPVVQSVDPLGWRQGIMQTPAELSERHDECRVRVHCVYQAACEWA